MPTVDDAIRLVTSRKYAAMGSTKGHSVEMRAGEIVNELRQIGTEQEIDETAARVLVSTAAQRLGGRTAIVYRRGGLRPGGPALRSTYRLWMPAGALLD